MPGTVGNGGFVCFFVEFGNCLLDLFLTAFLVFSLLLVAFLKGCSRFSCFFFSVVFLLFIASHCFSMVALAFLAFVVLFCASFTCPSLRLAVLPGFLLYFPSSRIFVA